MTAQDKAKEFLKYANDGDPRCDHILFLLGQFFNMAPLAVHNMIKDLADDGSS